jgi:hypothetical protein
MNTPPPKSKITFDYVKTNTEGTSGESVQIKPHFLAVHYSLQRYAGGVSFLIQNP